MPDPTHTTVPTALDFPDCRPCQMWRDAGASWPRPCKQHYNGEPATVPYDYGDGALRPNYAPHDCGHTCCDERHDPLHDHFLAAANCPSCVNGAP